MKPKDLSNLEQSLWAEFQGNLRGIETLIERNHNILEGLTGQKAEVSGDLSKVAD